MRNHVIQKCFLVLSSLSLSACLSSGFGDRGSLDQNSETSPDLPPTVIAPPDSHVTDKIAVSTSDVTVQVGNRVFVESVLKNAFLSNTAAAAVRTQFRTIMNESVQRFPGEFGGPLSLYTTLGMREFTTASCSGGGCDNDDMMDIAYSMPSTPARASVVQTACQRLLDSTAAPVSDDFLKTAIANLGGTQTTTPSDALVSAIPDLFAPGIDVDASLIETSIRVRNALQDKGTSALETWRALIQLHCQHPYWQTI